MEIDKKQYRAALQNKPAPKVELKEDQWQALLKLHLALLELHHDLYMILQGPNAPPALHRFIEEESFPARMWCHGVRRFLELLNLGKPESHDCLLSFINNTYDLVSSLYELASPTFDDIWIDCLGELACCHMATAIGDVNIEIWRNVARSWYTTAIDKNPQRGRPYYRLGQAARPNSLQRLSCFLRSQICSVPFFGRL